MTSQTVDPGWPSEGNLGRRQAPRERAEIAFTNPVALQRMRAEVDSRSTPTRITVRRADPHTSD